MPELIQIDPPEEDWHPAGAKCDTCRHRAVVFGEDGPTGDHMCVADIHYGGNQVTETEEEACDCYEI